MPAPEASMVDPMLDHQSTMSQEQPPPSQISHKSGSSRTLPAVDVSDESFDEAYVQFILFCIPSIPISTDASELRKGFRSPPKSDGKTFNTFTLFLLIKRLESKDITTWTQLVTELGVEPPDPSKNQSTQKIQQYAVRLKRWLHAFHIDAFFQYCLGKPHLYYTQLPETSQAMTEVMRDGVPPDEDLALRALLPEWRPKRGRRKADEIDGEPDVKRTQRESSSNLGDISAFHEDYSALPQSAFPWNESNHHDAWTVAHLAIAPKTPSTVITSNMQQFVTEPTSQQSRWRSTGSENTPLTPYPQSAVTPGHDHSVNHQTEAPQSAHPIRSRKRHGPAVSAAWQGGSNSTGKLRGRPPSNRAVQDGPFSTFPAHPQPRETTPKATGTPPHILTPNNNIINPEGSQGSSQFPAIPPHVAAQAQTTPVRKPSKLQLQVPQHSGGPVRLATPPRVLVNGEDDDHAHRNSYGYERRSSADFFNELDDEMDQHVDDVNDENDSVDWKRRAQLLKRKLKEKEEELQALRRRVLEAVM